MNNFLEILRWGGVAVGIFLANLLGKSPAEQFSIICLWTVIPIAGLTGIESVFFAKRAAKQSGYGDGGPYQRQSGLNNLAVAVTAAFVYILHWGIYAKAAVMTTLLVFLILSAINHGYTAMKEKNRTIKNLLRPAMTALLLAFVLPYMIRALASAGN